MPRGTDITRIKASTVMPAVSFEVHLGLTICFISIYTLLFFFILVQLCLILHYKHRRLSYQSLYLFVCLLWAAIRTTLFAFYFNDCDTANSLTAFPSWFLYALPIYLQFLMLCLLTLFMVKVRFHFRFLFELFIAEYWKSPYIVFCSINVVFLAVNITSSLLCPDQDRIEALVITRVIINQTLFVLVGMVLCFAVRKITKIRTSNLFLEGQGSTGCQATAICIIVVLLYISRAVYNIVAVTVPHDVSSFGYGWINVSDQGEINSSGHVSQHLTNLSYISYGVVLVLWEVLPTSIVVWFFRVRKPQTVNFGPSGIASNSFDKKSFFNNPNRYNSEEDLNTTIHNRR
ncbi:predicted protein [Nematostella vectensis]|uniref:Integral membrane protein GPR137B n=1 Tax=Nematostella vectensis TaxID=45351 RepID=A7RJ62_NEMVE|nr:predicted protein [Nematostella vectensis]|eukprot:XP_001640688.1 predicted protein [Nematostella vectensis]